MPENILYVLETFVRRRFQIPVEDTGFHRDARLFELGYVDSLGYVELVAFIADSLGTELPDDAVISEEFSTLAGIARLVAQHGGAPRASAYGIQESAA